MLYGTSVCSLYYILNVLLPPTLRPETTMHIFKIQHVNSGVLPKRVQECSDKDGFSTVIIVGRLSVSNLKLRRSRPILH